MKRRDFLTRSLALAGISCLPSFVSRRAGAQTAPTGQLVFVFLRGGADPLGLAAPTGAALTRLNDLRPNLAVAGAVPFGTLALHPRLATPLLSDAELAAHLNVVIHAGSLNETRSHFEQMARIEGGDMTGFPVDGILGRAAKLINRSTFAIGNAVPASLRGTNPLVLTDPAKLQAGYSAYNMKPGTAFTRSHRLGMYKVAAGEAGDTKIDALARLAQSQFDLIDDVPVTLAQLVGQHGYLNTPFGQRLSVAAHMLASVANPAFVTVDAEHDWDTHANQRTNDLTFGAFGTKVDDIGRNLLAFKNDLVARGKWATTAVVVITEFGRTILENANKGSDHGRGGLILLMGGRIRPFTNTAYTGLRNWTIPTTADASTALDVVHDYRIVLSEILQKNCGLTAAQATSIFLSQINVASSLSTVL